MAGYGILLDTEGLDAASQRNIEAEQQRLLTALHRHLQKHYSGIEANERYANILLRIPTIRVRRLSLHFVVLCHLELGEPLKLFRG